MRNTHRRSSVKKVLKTISQNSLLNKVAGLMVYNVIKKKLVQRRFLVSFPKFLKTYFVEHIRVDVWMKWTKKKLCLIYSQENNGKDFLFSAVVDMWAYSFSKWDFITDAVLWKLWSFTESHFCRTLLCDRFWFAVTFSIYHFVLSAINQFIHS